jgi:hypothetical protein
MFTRDEPYGGPRRTKRAEETKVTVKSALGSGAKNGISTAGPWLTELAARTSADQDRPSPTVAFLVHSSYRSFREPPVIPPMHTLRRSRPNHQTIRLLLGFAAAVMLFANGCGSTSTDIVGPSDLGPSDTRCTISVPDTLPEVAAEGGSGSITVTTARECSWSVTSEAAWISITGGASGQGNGRIDFTVAANPTPFTRRGVVLVGESRAEVLQAGAACGSTLSANTGTFGADGGEASVTVSTLAGCQWTASSQLPWVTVTGGASGDGNGTVGLRVAANPGAPRTGVIAIAGHIYSVTQAGAACASSLSTTNQVVPVQGGAFTVDVTTQGWCDWTATTSAAWISITSGDAGAGNGTVNLTVAANPGAPRTGTATIAGHTYTVTQAAPACMSSINPTSAAAPVQGGTLSVQVATQAWCDWTATSNVSWITVPNGGGGTGNGTVDLAVGTNSGGPRSGTATIAGHTYAVTQAASACNYSISPTGAAAPVGGASFAVQVATQAWCDWVATSNASWIVITAGLGGIGGGTVSLEVQPNPGPPRVDIVTIAGQIYTVTQAAAACTYSINPSTQSAPVQGGSLSVQVTAPDWCAWSAASNAPWITITGGGSGSGNGTVSLSVAANPGAPRTGTATIAGQSYTVNQAAATCTYAISPTSQAAPVQGGSFSVQVTAQAWCNWTATSNASWITVTGGSSGAGNGTVTVSVAANSGGPRTGTVTIAGQTYTVTQAAATCTYAISPTSQAAATQGGSFSVQVTAQAWCTWTATSNVAWITVTSGGSGTGNGTVNVSVAANTGAARTGTVTIAGQTYTVNQAAAACVYLVSPTSQAAPVQGGTFSAQVSTQAWCTWTATSNAAWIAVTGGSSGTGNGTVNISVAANAGAPRTGTVTIAGQTYTVNQAAAACVYAINPTSQAAPALGGSFTVQVSAQAWCTWTATSNVPWITVTGGSSGTGNGTVTVLVAANVAAVPRNGTVTIAGQTYTVTQAGAVASLLEPSPLQHTATSRPNPDLAAALTAGSAPVKSAQHARS